MREVLSEYLGIAEDLYFEKKFNDASYNKNIVFKGNSRKYTLEEVKIYESKIKPRWVYSEIGSINRDIEENKKLPIFHTKTLDSKFNIPSNVPSIKEIDEYLKKQYDELYKYHNRINESTRFKKQSVKIFDTSNDMNIHTHNIDVLKSFEDLKSYIKNIVFANLKVNGRTELLTTQGRINHIIKLFEDFKIRVNNKYIKLSLKQIGDEYHIQGFRRKKGRVIYFKALKKQKDSRLKLIKYFYKNILEERYEQKPTKTHLITSKLGIRIKQFSKKYFGCNVQKHILYRTNNKLYMMIKNGSKRIDLKQPSEKDKNSFLYYTAKLFKKHILRYEQFENLKVVYYVKNNNPSTKWIQVVDLRTYEREVFEEVLNLENENEYLNINCEVKRFYEQLVVRKVDSKSSFIEFCKNKKLNVQKYVSKVWKSYLEYLHYGIRKIDLWKYMEELMMDYNDNPTYKIEVCTDF